MQENYLNKNLSDEEACRADFSLRYRQDPEGELYEAFRAGWKGGAFQALVVINNWTQLMKGQLRRTESEGEDVRESD